MSISELDQLASQGYHVHPASINEAGGNCVCIADHNNETFLIADAKYGLSGEVIKLDHRKYIKTNFTHEAGEMLRDFFTFTSPESAKGHEKTFGLGDRLGVATFGHISAISKAKDIFPILAQQSCRELTLTKRTYEQVLDCVSFAVLKTGYKSGFGADGDHVKNIEDIRRALKCGFSMITLDSGEHIRNEVYNFSEEQIREEYVENPTLEERYLNKVILISKNVSLHFSKHELQKCELIFRDMIDFIANVYHQSIEDEYPKIDFEVSIDETLHPTKPEQHFFIANELKLQGVQVTSIAPRFVGEFQKGIDYIGDLSAFERDLIFHSAIADFFQYKLSFHSGSDKFSVYPLIAKITHGKYHIKTSGTSWVEAIRVISSVDPEFYRVLHRFAYSKFDVARNNYHVTTDLENVPNVEELSDAELPSLISHNDARQLLHITYGNILNEKDEVGNYLLKNRLLEILNNNREQYSQILDQHISKHLNLLHIN
jgi:hypothetical protein